MNREFDVVVWGATGFTGRLVAEFLYKTYGSQDLRWAMGGRSQSKLESVRQLVADESVPIVVADSQNSEQLNQLAQRTRVICTTVGPYGIYGSKLVEACVENNTHYCDLTGEVPWMRRMIDQHHEPARDNGTKIVHACGFDSIPFDYGVYFIQQELTDRTGRFSQQIQARVHSFEGFAFSGGTYASLFAVLAETLKDKQLWKLINDPYALNPDGEREGPDGNDLMWVVYDKASQSWVSPFVMAGINTRVVRRSNALADYPYTRSFSYDEAMIGGKGILGRLKGFASMCGLGMMMICIPGSPMKWMLDRVMPKSGEGPSREQRESGSFDLRFFAHVDDGSITEYKVTGDMDPGYGSTSKMLAECAVCLAKDETPNIGGVLTPVVAMGQPLLERLQTNAGLSFTLATPSTTSKHAPTSKVAS